MVVRPYRYPTVQKDEIERQHMDVRVWVDLANQIRILLTCVACKEA